MFFHLNILPVLECKYTYTYLYRHTHILSKFNDKNDRDEWRDNEAVRFFCKNTDVSRDSVSLSYYDFIMQSRARKLCGYFFKSYHLPKLSGVLLIVK